MKFIFTLFYTLQMLLSVSAFGATEPKIIGTYAPGIRTVKNLIKNPDCEKNTNDIASSAGTLSQSTSTPLVTGAGAQCSWAPGAGSATLKFTIDTLPTNLAGSTCEASFYTKANTAGHYAAYLEYDSVQVTTNLALDTSVNGQKFSITYPCGSATTRKLVITSLTTPSTLLIGGVNFSESLITNVGAVTPWVSYTATGAWSGANVTYNGMWRQVGENMEVVARAVLSGTPTGAGANMSFNVPNSQVIALTKLGEQGSLAGGLEPVGQCVFLDSGTAYYPCISAINNSTSVLAMLYKTDSTWGSATSSVNHTGGTPVAMASGDAVIVHFSVPIVGWTSQEAVSMNTSAWYVDATMDGASISMGVASVSAYAEIADGGLTLKPQSGSQAVGVMCSSTNAATAPSTSNTTCAAGNESVGINFSIPKAGAYEVCFYGNHYAQTDTGESIVTTFQLIETPTNAQTLTLEGGTRQTVGGNGTTIASGVDAILYSPVSNCSIFNFAAAGIHGVRLMYEQVVVNSPDFSLLVMDAAAAQGQQNGRWVVKPITSLTPAPLVVRGVTARDNTTGVTTVNTIVSKSAGYTATDQDETIIFTADATLTLPPAASYKGKKYHIEASGATTEVTIDPNSTETVCGNTTVRMEGTEIGTIQSDGTNWRGLDDFCQKKMQAYIVNSGSCAVSTQRGTWITSVSDPGTGQCGMVWSSATWPAAPWCYTTANANGALGCPFLGVTTTTGATTLCQTPAGGGTSADSPFWIECKGPR